MKRIISKKTLLFLMLSFLASLTNTILAHTTGDNERYNLAVYATGLQNDQPISTSLLTVVL